MPVITRAELMQLAPHAEGRIADAIVAHADAAFRRWDINTPARMHMVLAHAAVESAWFGKVFESMSYSAERLVEVWPNRFPTIAAAQPYAHNPQALANKVYGGRLGNVGPDDGWLCRGQGLMQTTGLSNFERLAKHMGQSVEQTRARLTSDEGMVDCAVATFQMLGGLVYADRGDVEGCTKAINGGLNGLVDRQHAYAAARRIWPTMRTLDGLLVGDKGPTIVSLPLGARVAPIEPPHDFGPKPPHATTAQQQPTGLLAALKAFWASFTGQKAA